MKDDNVVGRNICFTSATFDRQALQRDDKLSISNKLTDDGSLFLLFWKNKFLTTEDMEVRFLNRAQAELFNHSNIQWHYMGESQVTNNDSSTPISIFGAEITDPTDIVEQAYWHSLRSIGLLLSHENASLLSYTQGLLNWHSVNKFCSHCGSTLFTKQAGHALICSSNECAREVFPRTDPAVIVLVHHQDACLLGRAASWPEKVYSCLAGFVETGEDLESTVRREVYEESGVVIDKVEYKGSQPWPFPQSLMLGFHGAAKDRNLTFHDGEIDDAQWLTREKIIESIANESLKLPSSLSISYHLVEDWFNQQSEMPLADYINK